MAQLPEFERSYTHVLLFPPQPAFVCTLEDRKSNFSARMYGFYCVEMQVLLDAASSTREVSIGQSFLQWHRDKEYDSTAGAYRTGGLKHNQKYRKTPVVACRYWFCKLSVYKFFLDLKISQNLLCVVVLSRLSKLGMFMNQEVFLLKTSDWLGSIFIRVFLILA